MPLSGEAENWLHPGTDWPLLSGYPLLFSLFVLLVGWFLLAGVRAIVGEYFKLFWFRHIHTPRFERTKKALKDATQALAEERAEFDAYKTSVSDLLEENDRLLAEVIRLRAAKARPTPTLLKDGSADIPPDVLVTTPNDRDPFQQ